MNLRTTAGLAVLILTLLPGMGCFQTTSPMQKRINRFRADLALPTAYPLRQKHQVNAPRLGAAILKFARREKAGLQSAWSASFRALPRGPRPGKPEYRALVMVTPKHLTPYARTLEAPAILDPDVRHNVSQVIQYMGGFLVNDGPRMKAAQFGAWSAFFRIARPRYSNCGAADERVVCASYGGRDILVVTFGPGEVLPVPVQFEWWDRPR